MTLVFFSYPRFWFLFVLNILQYPYLNSLYCNVKLFALTTIFYYRKYVTSDTYKYVTSDTHKCIDNAQAQATPLNKNKAPLLALQVPCVHINYALFLQRPECQVVFSQAL